MEQEGTLGRALTSVGLLAAAAALTAGLPYYLTPLPERPFSALHDLFAPTGLIGQGLGILGAAMIGVGVVMYSLRKRLPLLARVGKLRTWLQVHVFLCLLGPFFVLLHTAFKFGGVVSIAFWCMVLVVGSGVFGRWVYVWIPRTAAGQALGYDELRSRLRSLFRELERDVGLSSEQVLDVVRPRTGGDRRRRTRPGVGIARALGASIRHVLGRRREENRWRAALARAGVEGPALDRIVATLSEERRILQQLDLLTPFQAAFRYWHAFHLPLATVMALVLTLHVGVAIAFGYTWIWAR